VDRLAGPQLAQGLGELPHGADRPFDRAPRFLKEQRIAHADRDRRASGRDLIERRHRHGGWRRMPQIGAHRGRDEHGAGRLHSEGHAGRDGFAIAKMFRHPEASGSCVDRALRQGNGFSRGDEAVEVHADAHRHLGHAEIHSPVGRERRAISRS
jgi:hypothetical protein